MRRLLSTIGFSCVMLSFAATPAVLGPVDDAGVVVDRWAEAYTDNDPAALMKLYAADAVVFGTAEPMIFDGSEPIGAQFSGLPGSGNKVRICDRRVLPPLREDAVLVSGSYRFEVIKHGVRTILPGRFTMLIVKHDTDWKISYHTSAQPQPFDESAAGKTTRQASVVPIVPAECL